MRKQVVIAALSLAGILLGTQHVQAQYSDQIGTTVNIILADILSIDDGSMASANAVDFTYQNTLDYNRAKRVSVPNSLVIISSKNFNVNVKSEGAHFVSGSNSIPVDVLQIKAVSGGTLIGNFKEITLSTEDQVLVSNASLGAKRSLDIDYSISAEKASKILLGKPLGTYVQKVTYTATAF